MAEPNDVDDDMIGTQLPHLETETFNDDSMADNGEEEVVVHEHEHHDEDDEYPQQGCEDGEEPVLDDDFPNTAEQSQNDLFQEPEGQQDDVRESVEEFAEQPEMPAGYEAATTMSEQYDEAQENGGIPTENMQYHQEEPTETYTQEDHESQEAVESVIDEDQNDSQERAEVTMHDPSGQLQEHTEATSAGAQSYSNRQPGYVEDNELDNDSSSLFVPERASPSPHVVSRQGSSAEMPPPARPSVASRKDIPTTSIFARIRGMQKKHQEKKNAAAKHTTFHVNANPDNEAYLASVMSGITPSYSTPVPAVDDHEMADREATAEYARRKRHYDGIRQKNGGRLPFRQDVEWMKIQGAEEARQKKRQRDIAKAHEEDDGEPDLFPEIQPAARDDNGNDDDSDDDAFNFDDHNPRKRRRELPRRNTGPVSMQDAELHSMRVALDAAGDRPCKKKKAAPAHDESQDTGRSSARGRGSKSKSVKTPKAKGPPKKANKGGRKTAKNKREVDLAVKQATSLFNSNVFQQQAGANASEQPTFRSRVKADALKELIASLPTEDQKKAKGDMNILLAATKDFDGRGSVKSDGKGLWLVKGMKTSLKNYQILGTAFMRRRENAAEAPKGGLMADQMGLGKTLMMLANIINGQPPKGAKGPKTTLLVASPALLSQWWKEIVLHTDRNLKIMRYGAGTRIDSTNAFEILAAHDIILTTYNEIMKSYPKNEPPIECQTAEQKIEWWKETYENHRGILHRGRFLRIVLDEAQAIKNHMGRTSIACRALMAHHKWALSGTPILNSLTELYPYFKFLDVPHTGSFKIFKHNYCDKGGSENAERLLMRLAQFMIRRTHADEMFGAPILKLPQADQTTYWCEFNSVERCIYDIVSRRFSKVISMWAQEGDLDKSYSNALVMLLRLRQLTAHVLMLQFVMRDLLEREDIERIKEIVNDQAADSSTQHGRTILAVRKQLDKLAADQKKKSAAEAAAKKAAKEAGRAVDNIDITLDEDDITEDEHEPEDEFEERTQQVGGRGGSGGQFGKDYNFKPFLSSLKDGDSWEKAKQKAKCSYCGNQPRIPFITSCGHLICADPCLANADVEAAEDNKVHATCKVCGVTPSYVHPCDPEDGDSPEAVAQGTRSQMRKKKDQERKRRENEDIADDWLASVGDDVLPSAKTIAVKAQIINWTRENPSVKVIIYTQFLPMVRILAKVCEKEGWETEQYHGKMSLPARDKAISSFAENPDIKVMVASLRCGSLGLNLTMASKVIMIDPWWNSASEQQAFCRVFRIGQKEETFMSRLCVKGTVDEKLIKMQERKQVEIDSVMEDDGTKVGKMSISDLMKLFGNLEDTGDKPYILVDNPDSRGGFRADRDDEGYADEF